MELDRFIAERIYKPLGLSNTGFGPIDEARAAQPQIDPVSGKRPPMRRDISVRPRWISGGSGLLSTVGNAFGKLQAFGSVQAIFRCR